MDLKNLDITLCGDSLVKYPGKRYWGFMLAVGIDLVGKS